MIYSSKGLFYYLRLSGDILTQYNIPLKRSYNINEIQKIKKSLSHQSESLFLYICCYNLKGFKYLVSFN